MGHGRDFLTKFVSSAESVIRTVCLHFMRENIPTQAKIGLEWRTHRSSAFLSPLST
jgi:hypothetical protein